MNCQVSGCPPNTAAWLCIDSNMAYCDTHKHPHGEPPHKYRRAKARRSSKKLVRNVATPT
jgi:hypothetical protein